MQTWDILQACKLGTFCKLELANSAFCKLELANSAFCKLELANSAFCKLELANSASLPPSHDHGGALADLIGRTRPSENALCMGLQGQISLYLAKQAKPAPRAGRAQRQSLDSTLSWKDAAGAPPTCIRPRVAT